MFEYKRGTWLCGLFLVVVCASLASAERRRASPARYGIRPNFKNYPHSNLLPQFFTEILASRTAAIGSP